MLAERLEAVAQMLDNLYQRISINGEPCWRVADDLIITLDLLPQWGCLVIGYATTLDEAFNNMFEDGDLFAVEEYTENEMIDAMLAEIAA